VRENMNRTSLIRLGGLAPIVVGGGIFAVQRSLLLTPRGTNIVVLVLFLLSVMAVIVALHLLQRERYGYAGALASALASAAAFVGVVLIFWGFTGLPSFGGDVLLEVVGMLVGTIGIVALGIFTLAAGVLPWWCGVALIVGNPLLGVILFFGRWPVEVLWVVVGFAVFRAATRLPEQPSRVH